MSVFKVMKEEISPRKKSLFLIKKIKRLFEVSVFTGYDIALCYYRMRKLTHTYFFQISGIEN